MNLPFKLPKLVKTKNGDWYVEYYFQYPEWHHLFPEFKRFKIREGINRIADLKEREKEGEALRKNIEVALTKLDYNPFIGEEEVNYIVNPPEDVITPISVKDACDLFIKDKEQQNIAKKTIDTYRTLMGNFQEYCFDNQLYHLPLHTIKATVVNDFVVTYNDAEEWEPRTYNNHIDFLITFFNHFIKKRAGLIDGDQPDTIQIERNPVKSELIIKKTDEAEKNAYYTFDMADKIMTALDSEPYLKQFIEIICEGLDRPKEYQFMKVGYVDFKGNRYKVPSTDRKTNRTVYKTLTPRMRDILMNEMKIQNYPGDYYIFSANYEPGPVQFGKHFMVRKYKKIKDEIGLTKLYTMYSWRHTSIVRMAMSGNFTLRQLMARTGHDSIDAFQKYLRDLGVAVEELKF